LQSSESIRKLVGKNIWWLRKNKSMGQKDLMTKLDIRSQPQMSQIENGVYRVNEETLQKIAGIFDIPFYYLYSENIKDCVRDRSSCTPIETKSFFGSSPAKLPVAQKNDETFFSQNNLNTVLLLQPEFSRYLDKKNENYISAHLPFLYEGLGRYAKIIDMFPIGQRVLLKLYFFSVKGLGINGEEISYISEQSGRDSKLIRNRLVFLDEKNKDLDLRVLTEKLVFDLESILVSLRYLDNSILIDADKRIKFLQQRRDHIVRRLKTIIKAVSMDIDLIAGLLKSDKLDVNTKLKKLLMRLVRYYKKTVI